MASNTLNDEEEEEEEEEEDKGVGSVWTASEAAAAGTDSGSDADNASNDDTLAAGGCGAAVGRWVREWVGVRTSVDDNVAACGGAAGVTEADDNAEEEQEEAEAAEAEAEGVWARGRMFADAPPACAAAAAAAASRGTMADSSFAVAVVAARVEGLGRWVVVRRTCPRPLIAAAEDDDDDDEDDEDAADSAEVFRVGCS